MFEVGSKVIITESSLKKSIGPKKGSIGYVISCSEPVFSHRLSTILSIGNVVFHRFGLEERNRSEAKTVLFIFFATCLLISIICLSASIYTAPSGT